MLQHPKVFLKLATKGHIVHLGSNSLKRTIQEHTISWKLHPESSLVCFFITLADEAREYESCTEVGIKQPRLSGTGTGEKEERKMKKTVRHQFPQTVEKSKKSEVQICCKDKYFQSSSSSFRNKSLGRRKNVQDVEKQTAHAGAETTAVQHSMLSFIKIQFKTLSNFYFQY